MTIPGKGWARRVTSATLDDFRALLRTGTERAAETPISEDGDSSGVRQDSPNSSRAGESHQATNDANALFNGTSIRVPSQFRSQPQSNITSSATTPGAFAQHSASSPVRPTSTPTTLAVRRWFKRMSAADAQRPRGQNTNPTGHLTLVQGGHPIQQATWFRQDLFAGEDWVSLPSPSGQRERAIITFRMHIEGNDLGEVDLQVTYTPSFEASQGNRTTVVHWGTTIGDRLRQNDFTNYYVTIERTTSGTFLMAIDGSPTGSFVG